MKGSLCIKDTFTCFVLVDVSEAQYVKSFDVKWRNKEPKIIHTKHLKSAKIFNTRNEAELASVMKYFPNKYRVVSATCSLSIQYTGVLQ